MSNEAGTVQKLDVQKLDLVKGAMAKGLHRLVVRTRKMKLNWWSGNVAVEETVTTVEPNNARH
ncbi:hypothetical protein LRP30_02995 [Bradyrhizobium sp. C-145]|uniref:hypothetical protein n=1 Tax=Bradyrhizobium sp. C-145 TaxID=574727 RepID=UPI00201B8C08|nr:hypothetical protein [Bradyrhizobium sp. C-145]UQR64303.1 hypothetical protein LRP30_02995 [Bradyrhizobium sp. C-145]